MTTINTIEDLVRLLDENPEWLEALRSRLLTRELLELPQRLAEFMEIANRRFDAIEATIRSQQADIQDMKGDIQGVKSDLEGVKSDVADVKSDMRLVRRDLGQLKARHARTSTIERATNITDRMGLERIRNLSYDDVRAITLSADTSDIPSNEILRFRNADLVMEATDTSGEPCYVAVEISYTANGRDTDRAIRNAGFLTRFTGLPAFAVVAGLHRDNRIDAAIQSGQVVWYQLEFEDMEVE